MFNQSLIEVESISEVPNILKEYGVCILKNALNSQECNELVNGMIGTLENLTENLPIPFQFRHESTWNTLEALQPINHMLYHQWSIGQAQFIWDIRCKPKIIDTFASLWGTNDLLVSFDGISFHLPPETTRLPGGWQDGDQFHTDQSFLKEGLHCIQGLVNGYDTREGDATLVVLIHSHKHHYQYGQSNHIYHPRDFYLIKDTRYFLERGCIYHRCTFPRGALVLWDSRTIHYGGRALPKRREPNFRAVVYLCYTPRSMINEDRRQIKLRCFEQMKTTNHWPHDPNPFADYPPRNKVKGLVKPMPKPIIPAMYLSLIGYYEGEYEQREQSRKRDKEEEEA